MTSITTILLATLIIVLASSVANKIVVERRKSGGTQTSDDLAGKARMTLANNGTPTLPMPKKVDDANMKILAHQNGTRRNSYHAELSSPSGVFAYVSAIFETHAGAVVLRTSDSTIEFIMQERYVTTRINGDPKMIYNVYEGSLTVYLEDSTTSRQTVPITGLFWSDFFKNTLPEKLQRDFAQEHKNLVDESLTRMLDLWKICVIDFMSEHA